MICCNNKIPACRSNGLRDRVDDDRAHFLENPCAARVFFFCRLIVGNLDVSTLGVDRKNGFVGHFFNICMVWKLGVAGRDESWAASFMSAGERWL